jgi:hypothetical protein
MEQSISVTECSVPRGAEDLISATVERIVGEESFYRILRGEDFPEVKGKDSFLFDFGGLSGATCVLLYLLWAVRQQPGSGGVVTIS